jgi:ubiquinol-cytochrome c reductase cytochrome c subunit
MVSRMIRTGLVLTALAAAGAAAAASPAPTEAQRGGEIFRSVGCWECHGTVGQGGAGPRLAPGPLPAAAMLAIVRKPIKEMPPYNARILKDEDVSAIRAYLAGIAPPPPVDGLEALRAGAGN